MSAAAVTTAAATAPLVIGRYALFDELAAGGMATVHLGRLLGPVGFGRTVAIKRLHAHYLKDEEFITMFMDEARIVARIRHPNVVPMVDVVQNDQGLFLVMEYVHGESLSRLMRTARKLNEPIPPRVVARIMSGVLLGLHAAHETKGNDGALLNVVHRDVSPQNVMVGADGSARVLDFGIAKAAGRAQVTREGQIKGKLAYMAPEQIRGQVDRRTDVFAAAVVLWEMLAGKRLHGSAKDVDIVTRIMQGNLPRPSTHTPDLPPELDDIVMRGLASDPKKRTASARELALELEKKVGLATPSEVTAWVEHHAHDVLEARSNLVTAMELAAGELLPVDPPPPAFGQTPIDPIAPGTIPVHLDPAHATSTTSSHEVPSSSAVFAHAQASERSGVTNADDVLPSDDARAAKMDRTMLTVILISSLMALIGLILGGYAITHRSAPKPEQPTVPSGGASSAGAAGTSATAPAPKPEDNGAAPTGATPTGAIAAPPPTGDTKDVAPTATAAATTPPTSVAPSTVPSVIASPATTTTSATNGAAPKPASVLPAPPGPTVRKPAAKPSCDPPFTVDEVGHRHYKPECMGLE